jgi:hypothetical protein
VTHEVEPSPAQRLPGAILAGALIVPLVAVALAAGLVSIHVAPDATLLRILFRRALTPTGWIGLPVLGAGLGALASLAWAGSPARAGRVLALGLALCVLGSALVARPPAAPLVADSSPRSSGGKTREIRRAAFRSTSAISGILRYTRDPDPVVREQAVLALGVNLLVAEIEHATPERPSRPQDLPLRDSIRVRLRAALGDPVEAVRAEAARALWKAPRAFGREPAAAESLAAILDRAMRPGTVERLAWLALDAAAGAPDPRLKEAAARFAGVTPDSDLARAARLAAQP